MSELDETAKRILEAAGARFIHYGYRKTTMSEIAEDCNMSPGNLYRYFASKLDIAEAFGDQVRLSQFETLKRVVSDPGLKPADKLRTFLHTEMELIYERVHGNPKVFELAQSLFEERPEFADKWKKAEAELIKTILQDVDRTCASRIDDLDAMAHVIQTATTPFSSTALFYQGELDDVRRDLDAVVDLILDAFAWRTHHAGLKPARG